ncbi:MAG: hypothetical protein IJ960_01310 [Oscillospiraceae bacterium]|nr:hypothetical protein [Oscillospiraceae bacterium]
MKTPVTLKAIQQTWNLPKLTAMSNLELCCALLPDSFNGDLANLGSTIQNLGASTMGKFVNGNLREKNGRSFANATVTRGMLDQIRGDCPVPYRADREAAPRTCRESMLCNIRKYVEQTRPAMTGNHPLFTRLTLIDESFLEPGEKEQFEVLRETIDALRTDGTTESLTYAVFLLVLTAVFRYKMATLPELYELQTVRESLKTSPCAEQPLIDGQAPFLDKDYMNDYEVYLFRIGYNRLYSRAYLSMSLNQDGVPQARLTLYAKSDPGRINSEPINRLFTGTPYRSGHDKTVYMVMHDQNNKLGILAFQHQKFNFGAMYFRSGLFLSTASDTLVPTVQRVAICARKLEQEEIPYVEGFLKTSGSTITLTDQQLQTFMKKHQNAPWMEEFERSYLPFINSHACKCYRFDEAEILSYSLTELGEQDRLRVMLALKAVSESNRKEADTNVNCVPPPDLHKLFH